MYLRWSEQTRADGFALSHLQIAEGVRGPLNSRPRVVIVHNCRRSDDPKVAERLRRLARNILRRCSPEDSVAEDHSRHVLDAWPCGDAHILERLWRRMGLAELIGELAGARKGKFPVERARFAMAANRNCAPSSKRYGHERWLDKDMRWVFFDTTSLHFEVDEEDRAPGSGERAYGPCAAGGKPCQALRKRGNRRTGVTMLPKWWVELSVTRDLLPVRHRVFPGNAASVISSSRATFPAFTLGRCRLGGSLGRRRSRRSCRNRRGTWGRLTDAQWRTPREDVDVSKHKGDNAAKKGGRRPRDKDAGTGGAPKQIKKKIYEQELFRLQLELVKLQEWIKRRQLKVVVIFEGRDAAGKGGVIKRITQHLNPRICRVVALPAPTERETTQWYFQRYVAHLPAAGEMVLFDRSWYNRAGVERVMGFCTESEYQEFMRTCPEFERMLVRSGIVLIKYWFSVSDEEQERRFKGRIKSQHKRWKLSPMDVESRTRWVEYSRAKDEMFAHCDIKQAPWYVVNADVKMHARLNCIRHLLSLIPYEDLTPEPIDLPERKEAEGYVRPPLSDQTFTPEYYP